MLVNWLEDSGWTSALTQGDIASLGTADAFIKVIHVTKTRPTHEITATFLCILLQRAYDVFSTSASPNQDEVACLSKNGVQRERINVFNLITKKRHSHWKFFHWSLFGRSVRAFRHVHVESLTARAILTC